MNTIRKANRSPRGTHFAAMAFVACVLSLSYQTLAQVAARDVVVKQEQLNEGGIRGTRTSLTLSDGTLHAELISDDADDVRLKPELRFNVWRGESRNYREDMSLPIRARLGYLRTLMDRLAAADGGKPKYGLLVYGYTELYERLPQLAAKDATWNRRTGSPNLKISEYTYLQELLNHGGAYRELAEALAGTDYEVVIDGGMENLRVLPVSKLSDGQRKVLPAYVKAADLLPARVSVDFTLKKKIQEK